MPSNIRFRGGKINYIEGDYTLIDRSRQETNIESYNINHNKLTQSYNKNSKKTVAGSAHDIYEDDEPGQMPSSSTTADQRREDYTRPPPFQPQFQSMPHQTSSERSRIENSDSFNIKGNQIDNAFNDYSKTHYYGRAPTANQRVNPQNQTHNLPPLLGNSVIPQSIQFIDQRMRQTFSNRSLSEGNVAPNMFRNNDDDDDDDESDENNNSNKAPPITTTSSEPIIRRFKGNFTKHDNSVHKTNILSYNVEENEIEDSFNDDYSVDSSRQGKEGTIQQVVSARKNMSEEE